MCLDGFEVVETYTFDPKPNALQELSKTSLDASHIDRLSLTDSNVTLPIALMMVDPQTYPSLSRARKTCRSGSVLIVRHSNKTNKTDPPKVSRVGDRVHAHDTILIQTRMGNAKFKAIPYKKPNFELPVVYQDDHFAIVCKPAGIACHKQGRGPLSLMTVRAMLPYVLKPPGHGVYSVMRRPASVHRLDKPTTGLMCVAKTRPAMTHLAQQFACRTIQKTYTAIVNGIPEEFPERSINSQKAFDLGVDVNPQSDDSWQLVDQPLKTSSGDQFQSAVTIWRARSYHRSNVSRDNFLTVVELKPKTGRYHQLRRHLAVHCDRPLVGDSLYDGGTPQSVRLRDRGLCLCANRIVLDHPYYNTDAGKDHYPGDCELDNGKMYRNDSGIVKMVFEIPLPDKFTKLLEHEEARYEKFNNVAPKKQALDLLITDAR